MSEFDPKKAGEEADRMIEALNQPQSEEADSPVAETVEDPVAETDAAIPEPGESPDDTGVQADQALDQSTDAEADHDAQLAEIRKDLEKADQRHRVAQGMIAKKDEELTAMRQVISRMADKDPAQEASSSEAPKPELDTKQFVDEYGGDMVDMVQQISNQVALSASEAILDKFAKRFSKLEGSLEHVAQSAATTARSSFDAALDRLVPDWEALNTDEGFNSWLGEQDNFAGVARLDLLGSAVQAGDANRASAFFTAYQKEVGGGQKPQLQEVAATARKSAKEKLVAPGKTTAAAPAQGQKRTWNAAAVNELYDGLRRGEITKQEFNILERDMFAAQSDGRWAA